MGRVQVPHTTARIASIQNQLFESCKTKDNSAKRYHVTSCVDRIELQLQVSTARRKLLLRDQRLHPGPDLVDFGKLQQEQFNLKQRSGKLI